MQECNVRKYSFEDKKKYLKRYDRILSKIDRLNERLDSLNNEPDNEVKKYLIDETNMRIDKLVEQSLIIRSEIYEVIDELEDYNEVEVLEAFFIYGKDFKTIADERCYSERHVIRTYTRAIHNIKSLPCQ